MKTKKLKKYKKPALNKHGNLKKITQGSWYSQKNDGIQNKWGSS